ncbi:MAG: anthranilate phosphoribosyltransferase [Pseudomonadota bacterium]|jgi:anthranilate phosphoribosyltransferase
MSTQDSVFTQFMEHLFAGARLQRQEVKNFMDAILRSNLSDVRISSILTAFRLIPLSQEIVLGALDSLTQLSAQPPISQHGKAAPPPPPFKKEMHLVDNSGTGGDGSNTFNISTMAAVVAAACGAKVAKFGSRSISSRCGSADVLEALGVSLSKSVVGMQAQLDEMGLSFLYAPALFPALQHLGVMRKSLGFHTIFDLLVPLANPAPLSGQLVGVYSPDIQILVSRCLQDLGRERALVVHSEDGLDELSVCGPSRVIQLVDGRQNAEIWTPADFGIPTYKKDALRGAGIEENAQCFVSTLRGENSGAVEDAVVINAAATLWCAAKVSTLKGGIDSAREAIHNGSASRTLDLWRKKSLESPSH